VYPTINPSFKQDVLFSLEHATPVTLTMPDVVERHLRTLPDFSPNFGPRLKLTFGPPMSFQISPTSVHTPRGWKRRGRCAAEPRCTRLARANVLPVPVAPSSVW